jgi:class I fructose-bisphosphate aldolase
MEAGATGLIFGRNVWQRDHDESLAFAARLREILAKYPHERRAADVSYDQNPLGLF